MHWLVRSQGGRPPVQMKQTATWRLVFGLVAVRFPAPVAAFAVPTLIGLFWIWLAVGCRFSSYGSGFGLLRFGGPSFVR